MTAQSQVLVQRKRKRRRTRIVRIIQELLVISSGIIILYPIALVYMNAVKPYSEIITNLLSIPTRITLGNFQAVLETSSYGIALLNSVLYVCVFIPIVSVLSCMAGYMIGRKNDRKSHVILTIFMISMAIPFTSIMLPVFQIMGKLNIVNTRIGYCLVGIPLLCPTYIFLYSAHVACIPIEMEEAAIIDGCGLIRFFITILYPLCKTVTVTVSVLVFMAVWNDYLLPSLTLRDEALRSITLMLAKYQNSYAMKWDRIIACTAMIMTPNLIVYAVAQKFVMRGIVFGAVKG